MPATFSLPDLSAAEMQRYSRHVLLPELGVAGQCRLKAGRALVVGLGGLGSPAALYLAAAGVGTLGLVDFDAVDVSNLQRQIIHGTPDVGRSKLDSAADRIRAVNPEVHVERHDAALSVDNALEMCERYDVIVDGTDNFGTRYLINDACVLLGKPNAYGSIFRFEGQASVFAAADGPCYRCLHPEPPPPGLVPACAEAGVLGVLPGVIGTIQATEALKLLAGIGETLVGRLLIYDALRLRFREIRLPKDPECPACGTHPTITSLREYEGYCAPGSSDPAAGADRDPTDMTVEELRDRLQAGDPLTLVDVRRPEEHAISRIAGAILIPLDELPARAGELDPDAPIAVHCRSGVRSATAVRLLRQRGFRNVRNVAGGILAWIGRIDPSLTRY